MLLYVQFSSVSSKSVDSKSSGTQKVVVKKRGDNPDTVSSEVTILSVNSFLELSVSKIYLRIGVAHWLVHLSRTWWISYHA